MEFTSMQMAWISLIFNRSTRTRNFTVNSGEITNEERHVVLIAVSEHHTASNECYTGIK